MEALIKHQQKLHHQLVAMIWEPPSRASLLQKAPVPLRLGFFFSSRKFRHSQRHGQGYARGLLCSGGVVDNATPTRIHRKRNEASLILAHMRQLRAREQPEHPRRSSTLRCSFFLIFTFPSPIIFLSLDYLFNFSTGENYKVEQICLRLGSLLP